ncbi:MAG: hypothetical protein ABI630_00975 [Betaproteobacteria bacterium]
MRSRRFTRAMLVAVAVAFGATGCMEVEQTSIGQKQGRYQGKPDGHPWDNAPLALGGGNAKWTKGDRNTWEAQLKSRAEVQNEYKRIGQ